MAVSIWHPALKDFPLLWRNRQTKFAVINWFPNEIKAVYCTHITIRLENEFVYVNVYLIIINWNLWLKHYKILNRPHYTGHQNILNGFHIRILFWLNPKQPWYLHSCNLALHWFNNFGTKSQRHTLCLPGLPHPFFPIYTITWQDLSINVSS